MQTGRKAVKQSVRQSLVGIDPVGEKYGISSSDLFARARDRYRITPIIHGDYRCIIHHVQEATFD